MAQILKIRNSNISRNTPRSLKKLVEMSRFKPINGKSTKMDMNNSNDSLYKNRLNLILFKY